MLIKRRTTMIVKLLLTLALLLSIGIPFGAFAAGEKSRGRYKTALAVNSLLFFGILLTCSTLFFTGNVFAAEETAAAVNPATGMICLAAALSTGLSCIGGGIAVSAAASAALGAISEDGSILGKSLIFVGLAEGVCLYGLIISFMIIGRL
ncbi:MAG: ATPase [Lachnospiraceae bacterium]|nr:ATPase [Lachnospiraceae bacterium]